MEPKKDVFLPYLQPLLDAPDSRYILRDWREQDHWHPRKYIEDRLLPPPPDELGEQKQSPILIVANMVSQGVKKTSVAEGLTKTHPSHMKVLDLVRSMRNKTDFQAYGPTRLLMWMADEEKNTLVPRSVTYRGKLAVSLDSSLHVEEIAGASGVQRGQREDSLNLKSRDIVVQRMDENGIKIPPGRVPKPSSDTRSMSPTTRAWHEELTTLEQDLYSQKIPQYVGEPPGPLDIPKPGPKKKGEKGKKYTPEYKRYMRLKFNLSTQNRVIDEVDTILQHQEEVDKLDLAAQQASPDSQKQKKLLKKVDTEAQSFQSGLETLNTAKKLDRLINLDDERRAFHMSPPLLAWDRRTADPLIVHADEFYSPRELALIDLQPLPQEKLYPMTHEQSVYYDILATHLFGPRGSTSLKFLDTLAPGAYAAIVPKAPAITDARRGGRRDVEKVRARTLTVEMLWQMAKAWDEWLFKPSLADMIMQHGGNRSVHDTLRTRRGISGSNKT